MHDISFESIIYASFAEMGLVESKVRITAAWNLNFSGEPERSLPGYTSQKLVLCLPPVVGQGCVTGLTAHNGFGAAQLIQQRPTFFMDFTYSGTLPFHTLFCYRLLDANFTRTEISCVAIGIRTIKRTQERSSLRFSSFPVNYFAKADRQMFSLFGSNVRLLRILRRKNTMYICGSLTPSALFSFQPATTTWPWGVSRPI